jgi:hypothetical protein
VENEACLPSSMDAYAKHLAFTACVLMFRLEGLGLRVKCVEGRVQGLEFRI